ncbi:unnamed protein product, partial [Polarella glacialis]
MADLTDAAAELRNVLAKASPTADGGTISSEGSAEFVSNHPLGIHTEDSWNRFDPGTIGTVLLYPPEAKGGKGKGGKHMKGGDDTFQSAKGDPWSGDTGKGNKGEGKGPPGDRLLEVDPTFLLFLIKHFGITVVFVNEEITDWSSSLVNLTPRDEPLYYVASPSQVKFGRLSGDFRQILTLWTMGSLEDFELVAITLLQELPGNHSLWQQMAPGPFMESNLHPYITSSQLLDASIVSRLHGAPHSRGWDIRTGKVWVTRMVHRQRDGAICKDLLSMKRPDEDRIAVKRTSDYWYVDYPNLTEKEAQTYHISLRGKVIERLNITEEYEAMPTVLDGISDEMKKTVGTVDVTLQAISGLPHWLHRPYLVVGLEGHEFRAEDPCREGPGQQFTFSMASAQSTLQIHVYQGGSPSSSSGHHNPNHRHHQSGPVGRVLVPLSDVLWPSGTCPSSSRLRASFSKELEPFKREYSFRFLPFTDGEEPFAREVTAVDHFSPQLSCAGDAERCGAFGSVKLLVEVTLREEAKSLLGLYAGSMVVSAQAARSLARIGADPERPPVPRQDGLEESTSTRLLRNADLRNVLSYLERLKHSHS